MAGGDATRLEALGDALFAPMTPASRLALARGLSELADAIVAAFPENVFWDLDALAGSLAGADPDTIDGAFHDLVALHRLFGRATSIRFRYVHDFLYGYDWAKWVRRDPEARADIGPYDPRFFAAMLQRGEELIALIAADDAKYHQLADDEPRNPFGFSREPEDELRLHRQLASEGAVPVEAWRLDGRARWDADPYRARERAAERLELTRRPAARPTT